MKKKVLITVKTYPSLSRKYGELVCTAGIDENGNWIRLYPIPFRRLCEKDQYEKYRWISVDVHKSRDDYRIESYKIDYKNIQILSKIDSKDWRSKKEIVLKKVYTDMKLLIEESKETNISLATFKPSKIIDFTWVEDDRQYSQAKLDEIEAESKQLNLFEDELENKIDFKLVKKLPYKFYYTFQDVNGIKSHLMIEDWEVGAAFWNFMDVYKDEETALKKMKDKFYNNLVLKRDLYFFLGTTRQFHGWSNNPFIIIGVFYPPIEKQKDLFSQF